jgi:basic membrane lipoprotein Med (substrate-binding protein (PBP1-ABC) superfamily)
LDGVIMAGVARRWVWLGGILALVACAAGLSVWFAAGGSAPATTATRARVYTSYQACLLTGPTGISAVPATQVWAGMEDASAKTHAMVSYLAVSGPATTANAQTFLGSLLVEKCGVIVAAGSPEQAAVLAEAPKFPGVHFVLTGAGQGPVAGGNVAVASPGQSGLGAAVAALIEADAGD